jgi:hypothetical protein
MGAGVSTKGGPGFTTVAEALAAGKTQEDIDAYVKANPPAGEVAPDDDAAEQDRAAGLMQGKQRQRIAKQKVEAKKAEKAAADSVPAEAEELGNWTAKFAVIGCLSVNDVAAAMKAVDTDAQRQVAVESRAPFFSVFGSATATTAGNDSPPEAMTVNKIAWNAMFNDHTR